MNIRKFLLILLSFFTLIFISNFYENKVSYIHFVDEEENMVSGKYLLGGEKLYSSIFATHQPVSYILSAGIQKITNPTSIFLLIKRHREFIIAWAIIWSTFLIWRLGLWVTPAVLGFEISKIFLLGNMFLPESLVVYPVLYLAGLSIRKDKIKKVEYLFLGLTFGVVFFLLSPLWPFLLALLIIFFLNRKGVLFPNALVFVIGFIAILFAITPFVSWSGYLRDVFEFNTKYYIPVNSAQLSFFTLPISFFSFLVVFSDTIEKTRILYIIRGISVFFTLGIGILLFKKMWKEALGVIVILGLANLRYFSPGLDYYRGFHLLPWLAVLFFLTAYVYRLLSIKFNFKYLILVMGMSLIVICVYFAGGELFKKRDILNDYYVSYSPIVDAGSVVSILKKPGDTLFVGNDASLIYWQADINKFSRYIFYYSFMSNAPFILKDLDGLFERSKPTFLYCKCRDNNLTQKYIKEYTLILKDKREIDLYILNSRAHLMSKEQKDYFDFYRYSFL